MKATVFKYSMFLFKVTSRHAWKALLILLIGLTLTVVFAVNTAREESVKEKKELVLACNEIRTKISLRLHSHALLLRSGSALFSASDSVSRGDWKHFVERIKLYKNLPGIQGVGFSMIIPAGMLQQHISEMHRSGFAEYDVKPGGPRNLYTSIVYIEPFSGRNLRAFGFDMFSEPVRRKAMEQSRDSDLVILSGKVILVQETNEDVQLGALMYVPVYKNSMPINTVEQRRAAIKGWVYSPYRINDLMKGILGHWDLAATDRIHLQIYEDSLSKSTLMYNSQFSDTLKNDDLPSRSFSMPVNFNGKKWILNFSQTHESSSISNKVIIILVAGISISFLLFFLSLSLFNMRNKAQQIADQLTAELRESEERFRILLNSTAEGIYGLDLNGNCTYANTACLKILGYDNSEQLIGKNMHALIHHSHPDRSNFYVQDCHINKSIIGGKGTHGDNDVFWRSDGSCFPTEYWSVPVFINEKIEGAVVTFFDITESKVSVEKIKEARYDAEKANKAKSEFLSRMSHELRTPLNSILGFAQLLEMAELNASHAKSVAHILRSGKHLLTLINEVLDISRIESGEISLSTEPVQVCRILSEITESLELIALSHKLTTEVRNPFGDKLYVKSDKLRLKQVMLNLLSNAIKYNKENGHIFIETEIRPVTEDGISFVRISVTDTGPGIFPHDIAKLFKPFERIGAEKTEVEGSGLGLAVVKKIMDAMGGRIGVDSMPGDGSTFWIELPRCENPFKNLTDAEDVVIEESELTNNSGIILYIEDNTSNIDLVVQVLRVKRPDIRLITDIHGRQALPLAIEYVPDLIFLDLNLPDIYGSEVLRLLREDDRTKSIPVVIISAAAMPDQVESLLEAGAKNYLTKPLDLLQLLTVIDEEIGVYCE